MDPPAPGRLRLAATGALAGFLLVVLVLTLLDGFRVLSTDLGDPTVLAGYAVAGGAVGFAAGARAARGDHSEAFGAWTRRAVWGILGAVVLLQLLIAL